LQSHTGKDNGTAPAGGKGKDGKAPGSGLPFLVF